MKILKATGVILAINRNIEVDRFDGKPLIQVEAKEGINNAKALIQQVLDGKAPIFHASGSKLQILLNHLHLRKKDFTNTY